MIDGISISGYRSFGALDVEIGDLSRINVFIGKNNCGKSNVLRFVKLLGSLFRQHSRNETRPTLDPSLDFCLGETTKTISFGLQIKRDSFTSGIFDKITGPFNAKWVKFFPEFKDSFWLHFKPSGKPEPLDPTDKSVHDWADRIYQRCPHAETNELTRTLCGYTQGGPEKRATDIAAWLHANVSLRLEVYLIDAFRQISGEGDNILSGAGLIRELRRLQSPELQDYDASKRRFAKIVGFLQEVLAEPKASIEIPAEKDEIYIRIGGKILPLQSWGTGIHELIILASAVTLVDDAVFCIEEPEIHLHPELQKKFTRYVEEKTNNQYLIASHSNAFFDLPGVNIYRCWLENERTQCKLVSHAFDKHLILRDLGYRPSDLLQANYVIWVEGPSDRIYINHWIRGREPSFVEGLHYAIMFYGGRLLAHLSYDDPVVKDFVRLSCLNRNACIVMDSDRDRLRRQLNDTKQRVKNDFEKNSCLVWVTKGRTIENYIPETLLNMAIGRVHTKTRKTVTWEQFSDLTCLGKDKRIDKVAVARCIAECEVDLSMLDLGVVIDRLIRHIREHN